MSKQCDHAKVLASFGSSLSSSPTSTFPFDLWKPCRPTWRVVNGPNFWVSVKGFTGHQFNSHGCKTTFEQCHFAIHKQKIGRSSQVWDSARSFRGGCGPPLGFPKGGCRGYGRNIVQDGDGIGSSFSGIVRFRLDFSDLTIMLYSEFCVCTLYHNMINSYYEEKKGRLVICFKICILFYLFIY